VRYEIVVFFVADAMRRGASGASALAQELELIALLERSAALREGATRLTLLTNQDTDTSGLGVPANVVRFDLGGMPLMVARLEAESRYVSGHALDRPLVLTDTDILINRSIAHIFVEDFDVAVTLRHGKAMPVNSGIRFLHNRRPETTRRFMRELAGLVTGTFRADADWWADQMALNAMVPVDPAMRAPTSIVHGGYRIRVLPVKRYNYSPPAYRWAMLPAYRSRYVLHFKSARRKKLMPEFFRRHFT
jgi:hypothetical protein